MLDPRLFGGRFRPVTRRGGGTWDDPARARKARSDALEELDYLAGDSTWRGLVMAYDFRPSTYVLAVTRADRPTWEAWLERERRRIQLGPGRRAEIRRDGRELALYVDDPATARAGSRAERCRRLQAVAYGRG